MIFKGVKEIEHIDRKILFVNGDGKARGHQYTLRKRTCLNNVKKYSFPSRSFGI